MAQALEPAYQDVRAAFECHLKHHNQGPSHHPLLHTAVEVIMPSDAGQGLL